MSDIEENISSSDTDSDYEEDYVPKTVKVKKPVKFVEDDEDDVESDTSEVAEEKNDDSDNADADSDNADDDSDDGDSDVGDYEEQAKKLKNNIGNASLSDDDDDSEDDEDEDEDEDEYFRKFDEKLKTNVISEYHPEMLQHNYEEIEALTTIQYKNGVIDDPLHKTVPILTKYERARILGERAKQINSGAKPFVAIDETVIDGYVIALKELQEKVIPFIIRRPLPNGACEYWKLRDLEML